MTTKMGNDMDGNDWGDRGRGGDDDGSDVCTDGEYDDHIDAGGDDDGNADVDDDNVCVSSDRNGDGDGDGHGNGDIGGIDGVCEGDCDIIDAGGGGGHVGGERLVTMMWIVVTAATC